MNDYVRNLEETCAKANRFITDVMPQIGKLVVQDFGELNELLCELAEVERVVEARKKAQEIIETTKG